MYLVLKECIPQTCFNDLSLHPSTVDQKQNLNKSLDNYSFIVGRLSLNNKKFNVTNGEAWRRINAPESFNSSLMGALLRRGKNAQAGINLRKLLLNIGLHVPAGRRRSCTVTCFTGLCEGLYIINYIFINIFLRRSN